MIINKYKGECTTCGTDIVPEGGFIFKKEETWISVCRGEQCVKKACPEEISKYKEIMASIRQQENSFDQDAVQRAKDLGLFDYQVEGVRWITRHGNAIVADEMGLGKTVQVLVSLNSKNGTIVVAPSHLKLNWRDEAKKWRSDLNVYIVKDKLSFRFPEPGEIVILTYGLLPEFLQLPKGKRKNPNITDEMKKIMSNTVLVFDEVQELKNSKTIKSKRSKELRKIALKALGLTGTPIMNRQSELWNICSAIGVEKTIFNSYPGFLHAFSGKKGRWGIEFGTPKPEVPYMLRKALLRRERKEVEIQLPDKQYVEIQVELPDKIKRTLDNAWDVYKSSGFFGKEELPSFEELSKEKELLATSKIEVLKKLIEEFEEKDILPIVFSSHQKPVDEIGKRKGWEVIKGGKTAVQKHKIKDMFQEGKLKGLAATIRAAGTGLTLTRSHHIIFNDLDWVPANNVQAEDRIARIGQEKEKVVIYHLVADHPLDRHIRKLILKKMALAHAALSIPKEENPTMSSENETKKDFDERILKVKEKEEQLKIEAITSRLKYWPSTDRKISKKEADLLLASIEDRKLSENNERLIRLLKFSGLSTLEERQCLVAICEMDEERSSDQIQKELTS